MRLIRPAHDVRQLLAFVILAAVGHVVPAQIRDSGTLVLDLTKPVPTEEQRIGVPGASVGVIGGVGRIPRPYPLPLSVELQSISPQAIKVGEKLRVEVVLRNGSQSPFLLPASQNAATVLKQGNRARRTFLFSLVFEDPTNGRQTSSGMASTQASETAPSSWLRVEPGQSVRVVFTGDSYPFLESFKPGLKRVRVRAQVSEWKYEDKRYFIESRAEPVTSANTLELDLASRE